MQADAESKGINWKKPNLQPAGTEHAYNLVTERVRSTSTDPLKIGETLLEDLLHEKALELSKFAEKERGVKEELLGENFADPVSVETERVARNNIK